MEDARKPAGSALSQSDCRCHAVTKKSKPELSLVPLLAPALKAQQLFQQARQVSVEHLNLLAAALSSVRNLADVIAEGGDLYAPGLKEFSRQLSEDLLCKTRTLHILAQRQQLPTSDPSRPRVTDPPWGRVRPAN